MRICSICGYDENHMFCKSKFKHKWTSDELTEHKFINWKLADETLAEKIEDDEYYDIEKARLFVLEYVIKAGWKHK